MSILRSFIYLTVIVMLSLLGLHDYHFIKQNANAPIDILSGDRQLFSQIGKFEQKHKIDGSEDKEGYLIYGPFIKLPPGVYIAEYGVNLNSPLDDSAAGKQVGYCDVNIQGKGSIAQVFTYDELKGVRFKK